MIKFLIKILVNSPFYPHWLEFLKKRQADKIVETGLKGSVLEVGAGDGSKKINLLKSNKKIKKYTATDYSDWNKEFENLDQRNNKWGKISEVFYGCRNRIKLDEVCSATDLPFKDNSFDYHLSFEVLEHIDTPEKYFSEATRVIKPGGRIIFSSPFMYRMHGGEPYHKMDYFRYLRGFFYHVAEENDLKVERILSNTGFGTSQASLTNQWLICRFKTSSLFFKPFILIICPFIFLLSNVLGWIIDIKPDTRFATRFHVILKKK